MSVIIDDNFARANTSPGAAGTTTGIGNGAIDAGGSTYSIQSGKFVGQNANATFQTNYAYYPQTFQDGGVIVSWQPSDYAASGPIIREKNGEFYMMFPSAYGGPTASHGNAEIYLVKSDHSATRIGPSVPFSPAFDPTHLYDIGLFSIGANPTRLVVHMVDKTAGAVTARITGTDTYANLQAAGAAGVFINGSASEAFTRFRSLSMTTTPATDANLSWSSGWATNGTAKQTGNTGQDVYATFTGASTIIINFDITPMVNGGMSATNYSRFAYSIDNGPFSPEYPVDAVFVAAMGLDPAVTHTVLIKVIEVGPDDRWNGINLVKITGFSTDGVSAPVVGAPTGGDELHYGDSIGEGTRVLGIGVTSETWDHDSRYAPPAVWSAARGTRCDNACFGSQGITIPGSANVPVWTASWDKFDATHSRLTAGKFTRQPVAIQIWQGENDYLTGANPATVQAAVTSMCANLRGACTLATTPIVWHIPFSGGQRTAITAGVAVANDPHSTVVDGGTADQAGLSGLTLSTPGSLQSSDTVHPYGWFVAGLVGHHLLLSRPYTAAGNVRQGTDRGDGTTGTLAVPSPANVLQGIATDNTTGTFAVTAALPSDVMSKLQRMAVDSNGYTVTSNPTIVRQIIVAP